MQTYEQYMEIIEGRFRMGFLLSCREAAEGKERLVPYVHAIHRRWYYSALVENSAITPANVASAAAAALGEPSGRYSSPVLLTPDNVTDITFTLQDYTLQAHPILADFRAVLDYASPHIDLNEYGVLSNSQSMELAGLLSIPCPGYANFLMDIAIHMRCFTLLPSIRIQRLQAAGMAEQMAETPDLLDYIIDAAISLAAAGFRAALPKQTHLFSDGYVRDLLRFPMPVDRIFSQIFGVLGYAMGDMEEKRAETLAALDALIGSGRLSDSAPDTNGKDIEQLDIMNGTFLLGILLDRYILTPFGHYLRLIRPYYSIPFSFEDEVMGFVELPDDVDGAFVAFFAPCSTYSLTELGLEYFNVKPTRFNFVGPGGLNFSSLAESVLKSEISLGVFIEMATHFGPLMQAAGGATPPPERVYDMRAVQLGDDECWADISFADNMPLAHLYLALGEVFGLKMNNDYSVFHDEAENRFAEYPGPRRAEKLKTNRPPATETALNQLDLEAKNAVLLVAYKQSAPFSTEPQIIRIGLELTATAPPEKGAGYPFITRMSPALTAQTQERYSDEGEHNEK